MIPQAEWHTLLLRIEADGNIAVQNILAPLGSKIGLIQPPGNESGLVIAMENAALIKKALYQNDEQLTIQAVRPDQGGEGFSEDPVEPHTFIDPEVRLQDRAFY